MVDIEVGEDDKTEVNFDAEDKLSESTIAAGYEDSNNVLNSLLNLTIICAVLVIAILVTLCTLIFKRVKCCKSCLDRIWRKIFFNFIIRTMLETFLEMAIINMIRMYAVDSSNWYEALGSVIAVGILAICMIFSLLVPVFLYFKRNHLNDESFIAKFGSLTENMNTSSISMRFYFLAFTLRRLLFAALIIYSVKKPWAQIMILCFSCSINMLYIGYT